MENWLSSIRSATKTAIIQDGVRKVHFLLSDGKELVEEYSLDTNVLVRRAWRCRKELGALGDWQVEVGDPDPKVQNLELIGIKENPNEPFISRRITKLNLEWRIRNLTYPVDTYSVTAEPDKKCLTVRTTNKKYFKKLPVPDLERAGVELEQKRVEFTHKYNTLIITYKKPQVLLDLEKAVWEEVKKVPAKKDGDMDCKPS